MKKLKGSLAAKTIAVVLFCALCLGFTVSAASVGMLYTAGYFSEDEAAAREDLAQTLCDGELWQIVNRVYPAEGMDNANLADSGSYRYEIFDVNGELRSSNYNGETPLASATEYFSE